MRFALQETCRSHPGVQTKQLPKKKQLPFLLEHKKGSLNELKKAACVTIFYFFQSGRGPGINQVTA